MTGEVRRPGGGQKTRGESEGQREGRRAGEGVQDDKSYVILSEAPALRFP